MKYLLTALLILSPLTASAQEFAYKRTINIPSISSETSVWIPLDAHALQNPNFTYQIQDETGKPVPFKRINETDNILTSAKIDKAPASADTIPVTKIQSLIDKNPETYFQPVTSPTHTFLFHLKEDKAPEYLIFQLRSGWIDYIKVRIGTDPANMKDAFVGTPKGTYIKLSGEKGQFFEITVTTKTGVLQIAEVTLSSRNSKLLMRAKPKMKYYLYYGTNEKIDSLPNDSVFADANAVTATLSSVKYIANEGEDSDKDSVPNSLDNCPNIPNPDQRDRDGDTIGDKCDNAPLLPNSTQNDKDKDGIGDGQDNCPNIPNADQKDVDLDGIGWACDDADGDGIINSKDNCVGLANKDQRDLDNSGIGDACEDDRDSDGIPKTKDNCSTKYNPQQSDIDKDGIGDECDVCPEHWDPKQLDRDGNGIGDVCQKKMEDALRDTDGDGIPDDKDVCPKVSNPNQEDKDGDKIGDKCDNCPNLQNPNQRDSNLDGMGDVCTDTDNDGILDPFDNCAPYKNPGQEDKDEDGIGDPCDDDDGDRIQNAIDNCPFDKNIHQGDEDHDGIGNACDDSDDRWSEKRPWLLWTSMGLIILVLTGLGASILLRSTPSDNQS